MRRIVLGRLTTKEAETALRNAFGTDPANTPRGAGRAGSPRRARRGTGDARAAPRDDRVEAAVVERKRLLDVRLHRLDPSAAAFSSAFASTSRPTTGCPRGSAASARPSGSRGRAPACPGRRRRRAAGCVPARRRSRPRPDAARWCSRNGRRATSRGPTAASWPSDSIFRRPSSNEISGCQPRICFARVMSGCRTCGSSTGSALEHDLARRAREPQDDLGELEQRLLVRVAQVHGQVLSDSASRTIPRMRSST